MKNNLSFLEFFLLFALSLFIAFTLVKKTNNNYKIFIPNKSDSLNINQSYINDSQIGNHIIVIGNYDIRKTKSFDFIFTDGKTFYKAKMTDKEYQTLFNLIKKAEVIK